MQRYSKVDSDKRLYPRVKANFSGVIVPANGSPLSVNIVNISLAGLMIEASQADFESILATRKNLIQNQPTELDIKFKLPKKTTMTPVTAHCRIIYVRRIAQNSYFIGIKFLATTEKTQLAIRNYVSSPVVG